MSRASSLYGGDPRAEQVLVAEGDAPGVLHRAGVELGHEDLVVGTEGVGHSERLLEHLEAALGGAEDAVRVEMLDQRLAAGHRRGDLTRRRLDRGTDHVVLASHQGCDVGRHDRGDLVLEAAETVSDVLWRDAGRVGEDFPVAGREHSELEGRLLVWLLEVGVHASRVGRLELGVQIGLAVGWVDEAVQAFARVGETAGRDHGHGVLAGGQLRQGQAVAVEPARVDVDAVDGGVPDLVGDEVEVRCATVGAEGQDRGRQKLALCLGYLATREVDRDLVRPGGDHRRTGSRRLTGDVAPAMMNFTPSGGRHAAP